MKNIIYLTFLLIFGNALTAQHNIIPKPVSFQGNDSDFVLKSSLRIETKGADEETNTYITNFERILLDSGINISDSENTLKIEILRSKNEDIGDEGYVLEIKQHKIDIQANTASGVFNALQTLRQMLPAEVETGNWDTAKGVAIAGAKIVDYPRFGWRGLMLDVSRHFFTVDEIKQYLDKMSQYKFNVFHWHLTDDQGWRIEIKSLPKLTEVGAWRVKRHGKFGVDRVPPKPGEKATDGGFYSQEDIKEIVKYAAARNITIVPEIDFPGHSMAALAAYPELSVKKEPKYVSPGSKFSEWYGGGKFKMLIENTLNPADEKVYEFVDKVFTEVAELFPGEYIHMGGDECYHGYWEENAKVQKFMKKNKIKDTHELQAYFVTRVNKIINSKGKKMIGWDEILDGGLTKGAAVMSWRGMKGGIKAAQKGHQVVMSPTTYTYIDYTQGDRSIENNIYADLSLEKTYSFEPVPDEVEAKYILGGQANLWTEMVTTMPFAFYMTYPRAFAVAESVWSPKESKDWGDFVTRTEAHFTRFDAANHNISKAVLEPIISVYKEGDKIMCKLDNSVPNTKIYYSINNTYPAQFASEYTAPFELPEGLYGLRTVTVKNGKPIGRELYIDRADLVKRIGVKKFSADDLFADEN